MLRTMSTPPQVQRLRVQTDITGAYTWTFNPPYLAGKIPVIAVEVEDPTVGNIWNTSITAISNSSVSIQITKTGVVTVLGINVLGIGTTPQAFVHLFAVAP